MKAQEAFQEKQNQYNEQQREEDRREQRRLQEEQWHMLEEQQRFQKKQAAEHRRMEEFKLAEQRRLQQESLSKAEITAIKDKVYNLALNKSQDTESIERLIRLILQQHADHREYIYRSIVDLGSPFDKAIKKVLSQQLEAAINKVQDKDSRSFQEKACYYFMPNFRGYEYELFCELFKEEPAFKAAVEAQIHNTEQDTARRKAIRQKEIKELERKFGALQHEIDDENVVLQADSRKIDTIEKLFGEEQSLFSRLTFILAIIYVGLTVFTDVDFSFKALLISMGIGAIANFLILYKNQKDKEANNEGYRVTLQKIDAQKDVERDILYEREVVEQLTREQEQFVSAMASYLKREYQSATV